MCALDLSDQHCKGAVQASLTPGQVSSIWGHLGYLKVGEEFVADETT